MFLFLGLAYLTQDSVFYFHPFSCKIQEVVQVFITPITATHLHTVYEYPPTMSSLSHCSDVITVIVASSFPGPLFS